MDGDTKTRNEQTGTKDKRGDEKPDEESRSGRMLTLIPVVGQPTTNNKDGKECKMEVSTNVEKEKNATLTKTASKINSKAKDTIAKPSVRKRKEAGSSICQ